MFDLPELHVDRLSFWLGFLAASLFWWILNRLRPVFAHWIAKFRAYLNSIRQRRLAGVEGFILRETIRRAQKSHIASALFPLDEIIVQPYFLAPKFENDPIVQASEPTIASQVIPYLPDWPEITASFGLPSLTPIQSIQNGHNIAIIGQPGSGKTIALAQLACELARNNKENDVKAIPILTHILDLTIDLSQNNTPLEVILRNISHDAGVFLQSQFNKYFLTIHQDKHRRLVILIDGLDELHPSKLNEVVQFISTLQEQNPSIQIIVSASSTFLDGLTNCGFLPLGLAAWTPSQRIQCLQKWGNAWRLHIDPEAKSTTELLDIDTNMFDYWLSGEENAYLSPLEWTMRIWGAYSGDLSGNNPIQIISAHINRTLPDEPYIDAFSEFAHRLVINHTSLFRSEEFIKALSTIKREQKQSQQNPVETTDLNIEITKEKSSKSKATALVNFGNPQIDLIIQLLIDGGVLLEHSNNQFSFVSPVIQGLLASRKISPKEAEDLDPKLEWSVGIETLHYASTLEPHSTWVMDLIDDPSPPLYRNIVTVSRWLREAPLTASWRAHLMRTLVVLIQESSLPLSLLIKFSSAFYLSRDPSTVKLFKHLLSSKSTDVRRAALIGCGALGNSQLINDVLNLMADTTREVRLTACLALSAIPGDTSLNAIVEILLSGDEELRQAAAEALSNNQNEGQKLLEEASSIEDLLARRAAVYGIAKLNSPWATKLLEKIAVEDSQWVVRNAASHALDIIQKNNLYTPQLLAPPWEAGWLLTFASKLGMGILPGQDAREVLTLVINSGTEEEQIAALRYLRNYPEDNIISLIYQLLFSRRETLREPALYALWWMNLSGRDLPNPAKFGIV